LDLKIKRNKGSVRGKGMEAGKKRAEPEVELGSVKEGSVSALLRKINNCKVSV
jgi:hypothetical protein